MKKLIAMGLSLAMAFSASGMRQQRIFFGRKYIRRFG